MQRSYVHLFFFLQVLSLCDNPDLLNKDEARALFRLQTISSNFVLHLCGVSFNEHAIKSTNSMLFFSLFTAKLVTIFFVP